jgi:hypothetical protein
LLEAGAPIACLGPFAVLVVVYRSLLMELCAAAFSFLFLMPMKLPAVLGGIGTSTVESPICSKKSTRAPPLLCNYCLRTKSLDPFAECTRIEERSVLPVLICPFLFLPACAVAV